MSMLGAVANKFSPMKKPNASSNSINSSTTKRRNHQQTNNADGGAPVIEEPSSDSRKDDNDHVSSPLGPQIEDVTHMFKKPSSPPKQPSLTEGYGQVRYGGIDSVIRRIVVLIFVC